MDDGHPLRNLGHRLGMKAGVHIESEDALLALPISIQRFDKGHELLREGERPVRTCVVVEGFVGWTKSTSSGIRMILSVSVPGDMPDLMTMHLSRADSTLTALSQSTIAFINHSDIRRVCRLYPELAAALWRATLVDASIFKEWVLNIGGRLASARIAHLFCEFIVRLEAVGLVENGSTRFPLTQAEIADATGLSTVHVSRTIRELRARGLIELKGQYLKVFDLKGLMALGDFDPAYLHLHGE